MIWAMKRLRQYLLSNKFGIKTDHRASVWLNNLKDPNSRMLRWRWRMEEYDYDIEYVKGKENKVADCLSRIFPITSDISKQAMWEAGIPDEKDGTVELKNLSQKIGYENERNKSIYHPDG